MGKFGGDGFSPPLGGGIKKKEEVTPMKITQKHQYQISWRLNNIQV